MSLKSAPLSTIEKKERARWARIKRVYGLTREQYDTLYTGTCPICLRDFTDTVRPVIDHNHKTGSVRGIICLYCNHRIIGRHHDAALMYRVANYLANDTEFVIPPKKKRKKSVRRRPK